MKSTRTWVILAGIMLGILPLLIPAPEAFPVAAWRLLGLTLWLALWWLTEVVPMAVTSLLPFIVMPILAIAPTDKIVGAYADPIVFLYLGGFLIAAAMQATGLHRRIALTVTGILGSSPSGIILGFMSATWFLSLWMSNTATAAMMFPVGISLVELFERQNGESRGFGVPLMLGIAYSASIGGVATLIGSLPNAIFGAYMAGLGAPVSFVSWLAVGLPVSLVLFFFAYWTLTKVLFKTTELEFPGGAQLLAQERAQLGPVSREERLVFFIFIATAFLWIFKGALGIPISDAQVAILASILLFVIPGKNGGLLKWEDAVKLPWGVLILFGGGLALAQAFEVTGLAGVIGGGATGLSGVSPVVILILVTLTMVALTELASNTATAATFIPIMGAVAMGMGYGAEYLAFPVAIAASCGFMLPVGTPPNAIVFAYKGLTVRDMARAGIGLDLVSIVAISIMAVWIAPLVIGS